MAVPTQVRARPDGRAGGPKVAAPRRLDSRRLREPIGSWRRIRSAVELLVTTVVLGVLLATILAAAIGAVVLALQHALNG
jgi:hypothetical protein